MCTTQNTEIYFPMNPKSVKSKWSKIEPIAILCATSPSLLRSGWFDPSVKTAYFLFLFLSYSWILDINSVLRINYCHFFELNLPCLYIYPLILIFHRIRFHWTAEYLNNISFVQFGLFPVGWLSRCLVYLSASHWYVFLTLWWTLCDSLFNHWARNDFDCLKFQRWLLNSIERH